MQAIIIDFQGVDKDTTREIGQLVRKEPGYEALPVIALTCPQIHEEELKKAGYSSTIFKPLRHATVTTILLEALGVRTVTPTTKVAPNPKLLVGKRLLVVYFTASPDFSSTCFLAKRNSLFRPITIDREFVWID